MRASYFRLAAFVGRWRHSNNIRAAMLLPRGQNAVNKPGSKHHARFDANREFALTSCSCEEIFCLPVAGRRPQARIFRNFRQTAADPCRSRPRNSKSGRPVPFTQVRRHPHAAQDYWHIGAGIQRQTPCCECASVKTPRVSAQPESSSDAEIDPRHLGNAGNFDFPEPRAYEWASTSGYERCPLAMIRRIS